jgi:hypothetical protein
MSTKTIELRKPVQLFLPPDTVEAVDKLAQAEMISRAAFIRRLLVNFTRGLRDEVAA